MSGGVTGCLVVHWVLEGCVGRGGMSGFRCLCLCGGIYTDSQMVVSGVDGSEIRCPLTVSLFSCLCCACALSSWHSLTNRVRFPTPQKTSVFAGRMVVGSIPQRKQLLKAGIVNFACKPIFLNYNDFFFTLQPCIWRKKQRQKCCLFDWQHYCETTISSPISSLIIYIWN